MKTKLKKVMIRLLLLFSSLVSCATSATYCPGGGSLDVIVAGRYNDIMSKARSIESLFASEVFFDDDS